MLESINLIGGSILFISTAIIISIILLEEKRIKITKEKIISLLLYLIIYIVINKTISGTLKTFTIFLSHIIQLRFLFKITYGKSIVLAFLFIVLGIIPDALFLVFLMHVLKIPPEICYSKYAGSIISTLSVCSMLILIVYIFKKPLRKLLKIELNNNKSIILYAILTVGCVLILFYTLVYDILEKENILISVVVMLVFVIILYSLIRQKMENDKVMERYDKLLEFIKKYEVAIEEQRMMRHETKNQLITVKSKVLNKENEKEIIKYVDSLLNDHKSYKEDKYGKFQYLPANGLKGLFYYKAMEAEEKEIELSINIGKRVEDSILSKLSTEDFKQLGRIVGVYLDNAIEASSESENKKMGIEIYLHEKDVVIIIENTYSGVIDTESVGKVRYTTKGNGHGYGLMLVNKIINSSNRFISENIVNEKLYIQKLIIKAN